MLVVNLTCYMHTQLSLTPHASNISSYGLKRSVLLSNIFAVKKWLMIYLG